MDSNKIEDLVVLGHSRVAVVKDNLHVVYVAGNKYYVNPELPTRTLAEVIKLISLKDKLAHLDELIKMEHRNKIKTYLETARSYLATNNVSIAWVHLLRTNYFIGKPNERTKI